MNKMLFKKIIAWFFICIGIVMFLKYAIPKMLITVLDPYSFYFQSEVNSDLENCIQEDAKLSRFSGFDGIVDKQIFVYLSSSTMHPDSKYVSYRVSITIKPELIDDYYNYLIENDFSKDSIEAVKKGEKSSDEISKRNNTFTYARSQKLSIDDDYDMFIKKIINYSNKRLYFKLFTYLMLIFCGIFLLKYKFDQKKD